MLKSLTIILLFCFYATKPVFAQESLSVDTTAHSNISLEKDERIDVLATKMRAYNELMNARRARTGKGYRLMVLNTSDRAQAMSIRSALIQRYPDHKVYMIFQSPFIKLKFGNYVEKKDAEDMRKELQKSGIIPGNIYLIPETIEVKPEKPEEEML
jgi:hypothetical protein